MRPIVARRAGAASGGAALRVAECCAERVERVCLANTYPSGTAGDLPAISDWVGGHGGLRSRNLHALASVAWRFRGGTWLCSVVRDATGANRIAPATQSSARRSGPCSRPATISAMEPGRDRHKGAIRRSAYQRPPTGTTASLRGCFVWAPIGVAIVPCTPWWGIGWQIRGFLGTGGDELVRCHDRLETFKVKCSVVGPVELPLRQCTDGRRHGEAFRDSAPDRAPGCSALPGIGPEAGVARGSIRCRSSKDVQILEFRSESRSGRESRSRP